MASTTVLVKLPTVSFSQEKKSPTDIITLMDRNDDTNQNTRHQMINVDRVTQLEQNMKFLQEQHQATLAAFHQEVERLCQKNRDLQFQLVLAKGPSYIASSPSSPEDNESGFMKSKGSPTCVNVTPLKVELLEKELQEYKTSYEEAMEQNVKFLVTIEAQKRKLISLKADLIACLTVTSESITGLRKENEEQRKEIATLKAASENSNRGSWSRESNNSHHNRGSPTSSSQDSLQSQSYWQHRLASNRRYRPDKTDDHTDVESTVSFYRSQEFRGCHRDTRGHCWHKERRVTDNHHHRRDYKDRSSKAHQKESADSAEGSS